MSPRLPLLLATTGVAGIGAIAVYSTRIHERTEAVEHPVVEAHLLVEQSEWTTRPQYPYSVVPGGVVSDEEFQAAKRSDKAVADLYRDVDHLGPLMIAPEGMLKYVSFRYGKVIWWTGGKRRIPVGEPIFVGYGAVVRERCGNRLSDTPQAPTLPLREEKPLTDTMAGIDEYNDVAQNEIPGAAQAPSALSYTPTSTRLVIPDVPSRGSQYTGLIPFLPAAIGGLFVGSAGSPAVIGTTAPEPKSVWFVAIAVLLGVIGAIVSVWAGEKR